MISVADLREALAPIAKIGHKTTDIEIRLPEGGSVRLTVRPVYPGEQSAVQRDVLDYFTALEENGEKSTRAEYLIRLRTELTSRSIVAVNGEKIPDHIPTGELWVDPDTGDEIPVTMTRHEVLLELVSSWAGPVINDFWARYNDFVTECEQEAERAVKYDLDDIESEIAYCEERLEVLKSRLEQKQELDRSKHQKLAEDLEAQQREAVEQAATAVREAQAAKNQPEQVSEEAPSADVTPSEDVPVHTPPQPRERISPQEIAAYREQQRSAVVAQSEQANLESSPSPVPTSPKVVPPHVAAREAAAHQPFRSPSTDPPKSAPSSLPQSVPGSDVPVYRLDDEIPVLSDRTQKHQQAEGPPRYERKGPQSVNPNFKSPA